HLQKKFDSASMMLQFINYAYAPTYDDGYAKAIGTHNDGDRELTIATKEKNQLLRPNNFSRNNAFIWQIRTLVELDRMATAGSLISTLRRDPVFPKRLENGLDEAEAYYYYRQNLWDSAATHLLAALDGDYSKIVKARWHYLAAQMMEKAGHKEEAARLFLMVVSLTPDPVMEVYARLNVVRLSKDSGEDAIDKNVAELLKMARRDKYEEYRDIIYYMAAQMELERGNIAAASELLIKGSKQVNGDQASKNKAFLQIADVSYDQKKYLQAARFYDSVQVTFLPEPDAGRVNSRRSALQNVVLNEGVISRQDSLQRIAALPPAQREALVKAMVKKLRKQQGLKEESAPSAGNAFASATGAPAMDLFSNTQKGEWYFYNATSKTQGSAQFRSTWGNRPNVDNWRRFAALSQQFFAQPDQNIDAAGAGQAGNGAGTPVSDLSVEGLTGNLPLTPETMQLSNDSVRNGLFSLGKAYLNEVEDYPMAIATFEELRRRFPENESDDLLFNLQYAYAKNGNSAASAQFKKQLTGKYPDSRLTAIVTTGKDPEAKNANSPEATRDYEKVYNMFIEGRFAEAEKAKRIADSTYKTNFWQPQLLYIESVYYIKQRQDSVAKTVLQTIINQNTNPGLTLKAQNLISVLDRRRQIEDELTRLQITRPVDDTTTTSPVAFKPTPVVKDTAAVVKKPEVIQPKDTAVVSKPATDPAKDLAALAKLRQKQIADSIALSKAAEKRLRESSEAARRDSLALAKKMADEARRDSLALKAIADKQRKDSLATAKAAAEQARLDSLAKKALADKQRSDSIAGVKAALQRARKDSLAYAAAMLKQKTDSLALRKYFEQRQADSLAKVARDSIALAKQKAAQAASDSLARKALADKQRKDSLAVVAAARDQARKDSIAERQALLKQQQDSIALARSIRDRAIRDSIAERQAYLKQQRDSALAQQAARDSAAKRRVDPNAYYFNPNEAHFAVVVLDKVDPIFVNEARNAFFRYNRDQFPTQQLEVQIVNLSADTRLLVVSGLATAAAATEYAQKTKSVSAAEIIPWLTGNKYSFSIISVPNLELLKVKGDMEAYKKFLEQHLPGKF
ncbi:MAG TPA: hypothetical protein VEX65_13090, partial [Flavisolibacter sp.]|nr:hypothetical protein [Flavisolibacter sp.]